MGGGAGPSSFDHLGGNNEQNYCVQLSSIKQLMYNLCTVITTKIWGPGQDWGGGGLCPPGSNIEPPLVLIKSDLKDAFDVVAGCIFINGRLGVLSHQVVDGRDYVQHLILGHNAVAGVVQTERPQ